MKKYRSLILLLFTGLVLTSCSGQNASPAPETKEEAEKSEGAESPSEGSGDNTENAAVPEDPGWTDLTFLLEEESLSLPFAFEEITDSWSIDPETDGPAADTVLSPGERTTDNIPLISEAWDDLLVSAGFVNLSDRDLPLAECSVWSITMDATWAGEDGRPPLSLPGGLTWGAGGNDIKAALGEPSVEPFYSESMHYTSYSYDWKFVRDMEFVVYDEEGLTMFNLKTLDPAP